MEEQTICTYSEPIPGMLDSFEWTGDIPETGLAVPAFSRVDEAIQEAMRTHGIVGCAVALVEGDRTVYARGFGWTDIGREVFTPATPSRIASVSKTLTGLTALRLAEQGLLNLDEPALAVLARGGIHPASREITPDPNSARILVRHLLDHTSGFPNDSPYCASLEMVAGLSKSELTARDVVSYALCTPLNREPGASYEYANINFVAAARILEIASGKPYEETVRELVLNPLGIPAEEAFVAHNQRSPEDPARRNEPRYYQRNGNGFRSLFPESAGAECSEPYGGWDPASMDGSGGWAVSVMALAKILENLASADCLLGPRALAELRTPPPYVLLRNDESANPRHFYHMGMVVDLASGRLRIEHNGMLQHGGASIAPMNERCSVAVVSNSQMTDAPWVEARLKSAIKQALS
jgi:CubicO group peptidase (beta-lactamase class C family)